MSKSINSNRPKKAAKTKQRFPSGWNEQRVRQVIAHYENQTEEELAAEIKTIASGHTLVEVPTELVPKIVQLIARHGRQKTRRGAGNHRKG